MINFHLKNKQPFKKIDTKQYIYSICPPFSFSDIFSTRLRNDLHDFKINSSDILFQSSSIAVYPNQYLGGKLLLFSKTPHIT